MEANKIEPKKMPRGYYKCGAVESRIERFRFAWFRFYEISMLE